MNGNLTGNGTNTYTWNTRNQLTGISGSTTASFLYDALGRRESKTISSTSTNFLYDGLNLEQELNGTTPTVNYLTGAGIDETLSRSDSGGTENYLTDNLGSTLALTSSAGAISTSYTYEPYGNTTASCQRILVLLACWIYRIRAQEAGTQEMRLHSHPRSAKLTVSLPPMTK